MVAAVVQFDLEVYHRVAGNIASGCCFLNALVYRRNVLLGYGTADDGILKDIA